MSAAFAPFEPHHEAPPPAPPAAGTDADTVTAPGRTAERPIRFPHIPSIDQTPPGMAHYLQRQNQSLRIDHPHSAPSPAAIEPVTAPRRGDETNSRAGSARGPSAQPPVQAVPLRPSPAGRDGWRSLSTQVEQIAEYLRRRRNELETEQTDLKLNALMQEAALLEEREHLRGQQLNIQMVQATLEILRRQLLELGNSLSEMLPADHPLLQQLEVVCQAYHDAASIARSLDVS